ncbi:MAG: phosphatidylethanolamine N-methyltransferase family protein [Bacteroidales bacterium]|nr:phosphatidylethanolamine N-methyltransferase family protein [Bacteroidales bacterium]MBN2763805.1 phosphatidylethanolamine N-methyltransferase family protein [Bacteroidales bacterium]
MLLFILLCLICLTSYYLHTLWHYRIYKGVNFEQRGKLFSLYTHFIVFIGYFAFGMMIFTDPLKISIDIILRIAGLIIGLSGIVIGVVATIQKKGYTDTDQLITKGIYARLRNPMYLGIIFIHIGLPLFFGSLITLLSAFVWIPMIILWKIWEEKHLENKYGKQYNTYKKQTLF